MASEPAADLPPEGVRPGIRRLMAVIALRHDLPEILRQADQLDLRDLLSVEVAYLERVTEKTVARWRVEGTGPRYRNAGGIRYPVADYAEWRSRGRQRLTAEGSTRGRRTDQR